MAFDVTAEAYGRFMGRFSEPLAEQLADLARVTPGSGSGSSTWAADRAR